MDLREGLDGVSPLPSTKGCDRGTAPTHSLPAWNQPADLLGLRDLTYMPATTPPGWAKDNLTKFLQATHQQQYATFHNKKQAVGPLTAIDELFVRVSRNWVNPLSEVEAMLCLRCHAAFRAAAGEAMAGQAVECYRQCRGEATQVAGTTRDDAGPLQVDNRPCRLAGGGGFSAEVFFDRNSARSKRLACLRCRRLAY
jgi:hypothetical protein